MTKALTILTLVLGLVQTSAAEPIVFEYTPTNAEPIVFEYKPALDNVIVFEYKPTSPKLNAENLEIRIMQQTANGERYEVRFKAVEIHKLQSTPLKK